MTQQLVASVATVEAIVRLAQRYPVFPCRRHAEEVTSRGRAVLRKPKSPLTDRGFLDASRDPDQIRAWWRKWPDAFVGVPTGQLTGLFVLDYDAHKASAEAQQWMGEHSDWLLSTRVHGTLNGGKHYLYRLPPGQDFASGSNVQLGGTTRTGIDVRAAGGYVIWWPLHGGTVSGDLAALPAGMADERRVEKREHKPLPATSPEKWARDRARVAEALAWVEAGDYDNWIRIGQAVHLASQGSEDGFALWHAWSSGEITGDVPVNYGGESDCRNRWDGFNKDVQARAKVATLGTVFALAGVAGWVPSWRSPQPLGDEAPIGEPPPWLDAEHGAEPPEEAQEASAPEPAPEAGRPERRPLDWPTLAQAQVPQREWAIPHWLGFGYVTLLAGPGGVGKSLLAQQMASSIAVADEFLETLSIPRRVLMWAGEDDTEELWRRQLAIATAQQRELGEYRDLIVESYAGRDCTLATTAFGKLEPTAMLKELAEQVEDYDADVVFLDNVARLFGGSENDRHQVTLFINLVAGACNGRRQRAVVLLGHPAKAEGSEWAGSTAWEAAVRSRWYFGRTLPDAKDDEEAAVDPNQRFLARRKSNYSGLEARQMRYDASRHVLVMEQATAPVERALHPTRAENVVLDALEQLVKQGVSTSDEKRSSAFLPRVMVDRKLATKGQVGALTDALYRLQKAGRVVRMQVGQYPNRTAKMGLGVAQ
jgi:RecA-family ATPase